MNPYEVLGVKEGASDEEIRKAYLALVKKYHPDQFRDNPLSELAAEKLKEVNEAYEMLRKKGSSGGSSSSGSSSSGYSYGYSSSSGGPSYSSGGSSGYSGSYASEFARARSYLSANNVRAAEAVLENIPVKNAEWYYLHGIIQLRRGAYDAARAELERAATMDPTNAEYRNAYESLARSSRGYAYRPNAAGSMNSVCTTCQALWAADCCCECLGGDFIRCI